MRDRSPADNRIEPAIGAGVFAMVEPAQKKVAALVARPRRYRRRRAFARELEAAAALYIELSSALAQVMNQAAQGLAVDVGRVRRAARRMIASILRNPDAALWLARLRDRDDYIHQRAVRSAIWAIAFGRHLGLHKRPLEQLALGMLLSDVGYARLPAEVVAKSGPLSDDEVEILKGHVAFGQEILEEAGAIDAGVVAIVTTHHERIDGSGYPLGLAGNDVPLPAQIAGVADLYDAFTAVRPEASGLLPPQAMAALHAMRGREFPAALIDQFVLALGVYPVGTLVELSTGEVGLITEQVPERRLKPGILLVLDAAKRRLEPTRDTDLRALERERGRPVSIRRALPRGAYGVDAAGCRPASKGPLARLHAWRRRRTAH
jgi:HD-GYP domain-containing protein (c-di-GMP phosphodiesterase class II)